MICSWSDQNVKNVSWGVNTSWGRCRGSHFMRFYVVVPHIQATRCATESGCASNSFLNGKIRSYVVQRMSVAKTPNGREWWQTNTCFATHSIFTLTIENVQGSFMMSWKTNWLICGFTTSRVQRKENQFIWPWISSKNALCMSIEILVTSRLTLRISI